MPRHPLRRVEKRPHYLGSPGFRVCTYNFFPQGLALKPCVIEDSFPHPLNVRHMPDPQLPRRLRRAFGAANVQLFRAFR
jgi:hypothetical protein